MNFTVIQSNLLFESERLIAKFSNATIEDSLQIDLSNLPEGADREVVIKAPC